jgi:uncharacterized protein YbbK (DUF523 family)
VVEATYRLMWPLCRWAAEPEFVLPQRCLSARYCLVLLALPNLFSYGTEFPPLGEGVIYCATPTKTLPLCPLFPRLLACEGNKIGPMDEPTAPQVYPGPAPAHADVRPERVLVSACLAGRACRFDGSANPDDFVGRLVASGRAVLVCPEVDGGLGTPRPPAEIVGGSGDDVLAGRARVVTSDGTDVTDAYVAGAYHALAVAEHSGAKSAVLKARSPSCGHGEIYDGTFSGRTAPGDGVTAALLRAHDIDVLSDEEAEVGD